MRIKTFVGIVLVALLFTACTAGRTGGKSVGKLDGVRIEANHSLTAFEMVNRIESAQPAFNRAHAKKMSVYIDFKGRQLDVKASCKIVTDSAMHISIQPFFGIELFKVEITPEKIVVVDKTNKTYYESNYAILNQNLGIIVDYQGIQSLLSNRLFIPGKRTILEDDFVWKDTGVRNELELYNYTLLENVGLNLMLGRIGDLSFGERGNSKELRVSYDKFKLFDNVLFPQEIKIDLLDEKPSGAFHFTIEEMDFERDFQMSATNLDRYSMGDIRSFFKK